MKYLKHLYFSLLLCCSIGCSTGLFKMKLPPILSKDSATGNESELLSHVRQITLAGKRSGEGYFNRDGSALIFQSEREARNPFFQMYLMDLKSGGTKRLSLGYGKTTCGWIHPSGSKVLFSSTHADREARAKQRAEFALRASGKSRGYEWDFDAQYDIYALGLKDGKFKNLTHVKGYDAEGSYSPDGNNIVFASNRQAYAGKLSKAAQARLKNDPAYFVDLYSMKADGTGIKRLTDTPGYDGGPFFSADGKRIVWRRFTEDGAKAEVFSMLADGSQKKQITHLNTMSWAPFFHPSGDYIIFTTNKHGFQNFELYIVDAEGRSEPVRITYTDGFDGLPVFSPDGKTLAWTSKRTPDKAAQIFFADWNDAEARRLLHIESKATKAVSKTVPKVALHAAENSQFSDTDRNITIPDLKRYLSYLASDELEGRGTGTHGEELATAYAAEALKSFGLEPAGDKGSYFQEFEFTSGFSLGKDNQLVVNGKKNFTIDKDWRPLAFSASGKWAPASVVFAGYGIVAPAKGSLSEYDSYVHLDVKDKWVVVFRFLPEEASSELKEHLKSYSSLRYKAMLARDRGARGLVVMSGPLSQVRQQLVGLSTDATLAGTSIPVLSVSDAVAQEILNFDSNTLKDLQQKLNQGDLQPGIQIPKVKLAADVDVKQEKRKGRNVIAKLRAGKHDNNTVVIVGAHIDHLGKGVSSSSLAHSEDRNLIHYGADDNASGVSAALEIAQLLAAKRHEGKLAMKHDLIIGLWSGEELGLLGSSRFARDLKKPKGKRNNYVSAYLNMDMVGRLNHKLIMQGVGSSSAWPGILEQSNFGTALPIVMQDDSYLPTDATSFYLRGVPILSAFTGAHTEYHTPRDVESLINYEGLKSVTDLMARLTEALLKRSGLIDYQELSSPRNVNFSGGLRAYLGTVPDYVETNIKGLKLSGVVKGGPAEKAGLRGGDIVVSLGGKVVENVYDYTFAIGAVEIGKATPVEILRGGQKMKLTVIPKSRE